METEKRLIDIEYLEPYAVDILGAKFIPYAALKDVAAVDAVILPCKIGDKVYRIDNGDYHSNWKPFIQELTVTEISWKKEKHGDKDLGFAIIADGIRYKFSSIGKSVFLTKAEAEAKMYKEETR